MNLAKLRGLMNKRVKRHNMPVRIVGKSAKLTALGTIKILSGFTVIVPIIFAKSSKDPFDLREDRVIISGVSMPNNHKPVSHILHGVVYHLIKKSALAKINFRFKSQPGELVPVYLINPSRLDASNKDGWIALT